MFSKRAKPCDDATSPSKRFRCNAGDLFLSNDISGERAASLFRDAALAGTQHVGDLAKIKGGNVHRDVLRKMRSKRWPKLYKAKVRVWNRKLQATEVVEVPVLLPHEVLHEIARKSDVETMCSRDNLTDETLEHIGKARASLGDGPPICCLGLWMDGTPCNWDRSESVETIAMSIPNLTGPNAAMRIPFAVVMHKHCISNETLDDLLEVFTWSLDCLALGSFPAKRHDGADFGSGEQQRAKKAGAPLNIRAILIEVRADWKCLKDVFRLPGWQENDGCCWKCIADHQTRRDCSRDAVWRTARLTHFDNLLRWKRKNIVPNTIFSAPFFCVCLFVLDWLHIMDLGVACDFLGNIFKMLLAHQHGTNQKTRVENLYKQMVEYYERHSVDNRLDNLTLSMLGKDRKPPKLRAKAAEARGLISFAREQAELHLLDANALECAAKQASIHLEACYFCLHAQTFKSEVMAEHSRTFCLLLAALEETAEQPNWRLKPKAHLMQEMCEMMKVNPSKHWTYRDEDFGGSMAAMARVRGCKGSAKVVGQNVLLKFQAKCKLPVF